MEWYWIPVGTTGTPDLPRYSDGRGAYGVIDMAQQAVVPRRASSLTGAIEGRTVTIEGRTVTIEVRSFAIVRSFVQWFKAMGSE